MKTAGDRTRWPAPAKLNLFLHITGRRPDGYHDLQTLFQFVDWCDWLEFEPNGGGVVRCAGLAGVADRDNLVLRAARLLQQRAGSTAGVSIRVEKHLPAGAGLGGGSSDAATTLVALNRLWNLRLSPAELAAAGLELGADVPVFVRGRAALAEGRGELLTPVELARPWYVIVNPGVSVSTAAVFKHPALTRNSAKETISRFALAPGRNDCEAAVRALAPEAGKVLDWLSRHGRAHLTGTGGAVFAAFNTRQKAETVAGRAPAPWQARVARGLNTSPLYQGNRGANVAESP